MTLFKIKPRFTDSIPYGLTGYVRDRASTKQENAAQEYSFVPRANVLENDKQFEVQLELAGFNKKHIEISVEKGILTVTGERNEDQAENSVRYLTRQLTYGKFKRAFYVPEDVDDEKINASLDNGILSITLPKVESKVLKKLVSID